jgi:hypothetical protein
MIKDLLKPYSLAARLGLLPSAAAAAVLASTGIAAANPSVDLVTINPTSLDYVLVGSPGTNYSFGAVAYPVDGGITAIGGTPEGVNNMGINGMQPNTTYIIVFDLHNWTTGATYNFETNTATTAAIAAATDVGIQGFYWSGTNPIVTVGWQPSSNAPAGSLYNLSVEATNSGFSSTGSHQTNAGSATQGAVVGFENARNSAGVSLTYDGTATAYTSSTNSINIPATPGMPASLPGNFSIVGENTNTGVSTISFGTWSPAGWPIGINYSAKIEKTDMFGEMNNGTLLTTNLGTNNQIAFKAGYGHNFYNISVMPSAGSLTNTNAATFLYGSPSSEPLAWIDPSTLVAYQPKNNGSNGFGFTAYVQVPQTANTPAYPYWYDLGSSTLINSNGWVDVYGVYAPTYPTRGLAAEGGFAWSALNVSIPTPTNSSGMKLFKLLGSGSRYTVGQAVTNTIKNGSGTNGGVISYGMQVPATLNPWPYPGNINN